MCALLQLLVWVLLPGSQSGMMSMLCMWACSLMQHHPAYGVHLYAHPSSGCTCSMSRRCCPKPVCSMLLAPLLLSKLWQTI